MKHFQSKELLLFNMTAIEENKQAKETLGRPSLKASRSKNFSKATLRQHQSKKTLGREEGLSRILNPQANVKHRKVFDISDERLRKISMLSTTRSIAEVAGSNLHLIDIYNEAHKFASKRQS